MCSLFRFIHTCQHVICKISLVLPRAWYSPVEGSSCYKPIPSSRPRKTQAMGDSFVQHKFDIAQQISNSPSMQRSHANFPKGTSTSRNYVTESVRKLFFVLMDTSCSPTLLLFFSADKNPVFVPFSVVFGFIYPWLLSNTAGLKESPTYPLLYHPNYHLHH